MSENPLVKVHFTQGYELTANDVVSELTSLFGVGDEEIFQAIPQLRNPEEREYRLRKPPTHISPRREGDVIVMLEGTGVDPLVTFVIKASEGVKTYAYRAFWQDYYGGQPKIE